MKQKMEETNPGLVVEVPDLNKIYVDDIHATLQWMFGKVDAGQ